MCKRLKDAGVGLGEGSARWLWSGGRFSGERFAGREGFGNASGNFMGYEFEAGYMDISHYQERV